MFFYAARLKIKLNIVFGIKKNPETIAISGFLYGGQYRTRTCDPMHVKSHPFVFYCILIIIRRYFDEKVLFLWDSFHCVHHVFAQSGSRFGSGDVQTQYFVRR